MKNRNHFLLFGVAAALSAAPVVSAQGTAFTYQGKLTDDCCPATGLYDLTFKVFDSAGPGTTGQQGSTVSLTRVPVTNGLFTVKLDYGNGVFTGARRWLQIDARTNNAALTPVTLLPRTELTPTPYSLFAQKAGMVPDGAITPAMISGSGASAGQVLTYNGSSVAWATGNGVFALNGTSAYYNGGNLGIGTANPAAPLELKSGLDREILRFGYSPTDYHYISTSFNGGANPFANYLGFNLEYTSSDVRRVLTLRGDGTVGIGTGEPGRRLTVVAGFDGDGIQVIGSRLGPKDAGYVLTDDAGSRAAMGLASFANAWFTGAQPGDFVLGANQGNIRIGVGSGLDFPVMSVGRSQVTISPNDHGNPGNIVLTAGSVDGTAFYCHSYGLPFRAHNDFTGTDVVLAGGQAAGFTGDVSVSGALSVSRGISGQVNGIAFGRGVFGKASGDPNSYGGLFQYGSDGNNAAYLGGNGVAADFYGPVHVNGVATVNVLTITGGADMAEPFHMSNDDIPKGAVVVIDEEHPGQLKMSTGAYDTRVAGIVSGANGIKPGITLHQEGVVEGSENVALNGRVYALADASHGPIKPGDLLTTSDTAGHCMKVTDHAKAQGAIIGKAMSTLAEGKGMVLVLVSLQ